MYKTPNEIRRWIFHCRNRIHVYSKLNPLLTDIYQNQNITDILKREKPANFVLGRMKNEKDILLYHSLATKYGFYRDGPKGYEVLKKRQFLVEIPNYENLQYVIKQNIDSLSFQTSISNTYLLKTFDKTTKDVKLEFSEMYQYMKHLPQYDMLHKKLTIHCITECPYTGKTDPIYVVREILEYDRQYDFTEICLCDTTGTILWDDFEYLIQYCIFFGIHPSKLALQFQICPENIDRIQKMIHYALHMGIHKFDVCYDTELNEIHSKRGNKKHVSYAFFYHSLAEYIHKKVVQKPV